MIGSTLRSLPYVDNLRKALESGTATAGRIQVANATPEIEARLDENFRDTQRTLEQLAASSKAGSSWATLDEKSNAVDLPNVETLSNSDASQVLNSLQHLIDIGRLEGKTINAKNGDQATDSAAVYQQWLLARVGVDAYA
ncbi:hypothetical protein [Pseudomonas viciae]|uniref:hypothetical protein n=1 Tax=Pseudomonas viciae TaxID=2505979 RepID=UPI0022343F81|nr:hypothetical protein [Pseudomonas viciae]UZE84902.1 hypothetical protein LOY66_20260 [Pseudomonas viciae]